MSFKKWAKGIWKFIWEDDSIWSWIANIAIAFVLIKFVVYPGLGFLLGTSHPVVAVVSESMEHKKPFDQWWAESPWYAQNGISKEEFLDFRMRNGFNKGDIIVLVGAEDAGVGDIIVFQSGKPEPIIHRVVSLSDDGKGRIFQTKGDHNAQQIKNPIIDETHILEEQVIGKAVIKIPLFGYVKIWFVEIYNTLRAAFS